MPFIVTILHFHLSKEITYTNTRNASGYAGSPGEMNYQKKKTKQNINYTTQNGLLLHMNISNKRFDEKES